LHGTVVVFKPVSNYLVEKNRGKKKIYLKLETQHVSSPPAALSPALPQPLLLFRSVEVVVAVVVIDVEISAKNE
jgi:hypothetical protein